MSVQYSVTVNNARLDAIASTVGASPVLTIRTGAAPANCSAANSGTVLSTVNLPSTWMNSASGASISKTGTWQDTSADATGTAAHFRLYDSSGVCHIQGTVGLTSADMIVDSTSFTAGQTFTINSFTINSGNL